MRSLLVLVALAASAICSRADTLTMKGQADLILYNPNPLFFSNPLVNGAAAFSSPTGWAGNSVGWTITQDAINPAIFDVSWYMMDVGGFYCEPERPHSADCDIGLNVLAKFIGTATGIFDPANDTWTFHSLVRGALAGVIQDYTGVDWRGATVGTIDFVITCANDCQGPGQGSGSGGVVMSGTFNAVPEPGATSLFLLGLGGASFIRRRHL